MEKDCKHCGAVFSTDVEAKVYCRRQCGKNAAKKRHMQKTGGWKTANLSPTAAARRIRNKQRRRQKNLDYVYTDKYEKGCSRCPERRPSCLDYHHLDRGTKLDEISRLARLGLSFEKLVAEMEKCILLCANCHRVEELGDGYQAF